MADEFPSDSQYPLKTIEKLEEVCLEVDNSIDHLDFLELNRADPLKYWKLAFKNEAQTNFVVNNGATHRIKKVMEQFCNGEDIERLISKPMSEFKKSKMKKPASLTRNIDKDTTYLPPGHSLTKILNNDSSWCQLMDDIYGETMSDEQFEISMKQDINIADEAVITLQETFQRCQTKHLPDEPFYQIDFGKDTPEIVMRNLDEGYVNRFLNDEIREVDLGEHEQTKSSMPFTVSPTNAQVEPKVKSKPNEHRVSYLPEDIDYNASIAIGNIMQGVAHSTPIQPVQPRALQKSTPIELEQPRELFSNNITAQLEPEAQLVEVMPIAEPLTTDISAPVPPLEFMAPPEQRVPVDEPLPIEPVIQIPQLAPPEEVPIQAPIVPEIILDPDVLDSLEPTIRPIRRRRRIDTSESSVDHEPALTLLRKKKKKHRNLIEVATIRIADAHGLGFMDDYSNFPQNLLDEAIIATQREIESVVERTQPTEQRLETTQDRLELPIPNRESVLMQNVDQSHPIDARLDTTVGPPELPVHNLRISDIIQQPLDKIINDPLIDQLRESQFVQNTSLMNVQRASSIGLASGIQRQGLNSLEIHQLDLPIDIMPSRDLPLLNMTPSNSTKAQENLPQVPGVQITQNIRVFTEKEKRLITIFMELLTLKAKIKRNVFTVDDVLKGHENKRQAYCDLWKLFAQVVIKLHVNEMNHVTAVELLKY